MSKLHKLESFLTLINKLLLQLSINLVKIITHVFDGRHFGYTTKQTPTDAIFVTQQNEPNIEQPIRLHPKYRTFAKCLVIFVKKIFFQNDTVITKCPNIGKKNNF